MAVRWFDKRAFDQEAVMRCRGCRKRDAKFRVRGGRVKADDQHDLCFQCYRAHQNKRRAQRMKAE